MSRLCIGCMTGTSIDGLDVAALSVHGFGLEMSASVIAFRSFSFAESGVEAAGMPLAAALRALAEQRPLAAGEIAAIAHAFSKFHAACIRVVLAMSGGTKASLISVHGQTVFHKPPLSWQLINAPLIALEAQAPVVFDLRAADLAAGGQGAPITPLADWVLYRIHEGFDDRPRAIVNLGGFCNATLLPPSTAGRAPADEAAQVRGFDVCACNQVLDAVARAVLGRPYDEFGAAALAGVVHGPACRELELTLHDQALARRSLGTGDEAQAWISRHSGRIPPDDLAATAAWAVGSTIARRLTEPGETHRPAHLTLAGGGASNQALVRAIRESMSAVVECLDERHGPSQAREAAAMAVLGALCRDRVPITLPAVTGVAAPAPISGCWAFV